MQHLRRPETHSVASAGRVDERGQGLVEFALILPLVVLMFFGIIQFGFTLGGHIALVNAVREATRYASASAPNSTNPTPAEQATTAIARAVPGYTNTAVVNASYCWYRDPLTPVTYSVRIHMDVTYGHQLFVPLVGRIIDGIDGAVDNRFTVTVQEDMRVESQPYKSLQSLQSRVPLACTNP